MRTDPTAKNVVLLALCQALGMSCAALAISVTALVGNSLAPDRNLITLPLALQFLAMMASAAPASLFMRHFGRRAGLSLGAGLGCLAGLLGTWAIFAGDFVLFCASSILFGAFSAHVQFYRFAAADTASPAFRSRAISLVLAGGLLSAVLGPELAKRSVDLFAPVLFAGCYLGVAGLAALSLVILRFIEIPRPGAEERRGGGRPLREIARQRAFVVAVLCAMVGYGSMNLVMTVTPLAVIACQHSFDTAAFVIQWHIVGMYGPSFFTGHLIKRFGAAPILGLGAILMLGLTLVDAVFAFYLADWSVTGTLTWMVLLLGFLCAGVYNFMVCDFQAARFEDST